MKKAPRRLRLAAASAALMGGPLAVMALAAPSAPTITDAPPRWSQNPAPSIGWASGGGGNGTFLWSLNGGGPNETTATAVTLGPLADGDYTFTVREDGDPDPENPDDPGDPGPSRSTSFGVDTTPPTLTRTISGVAGDNGWYRSTVTIGYSCADAASGIPGGCPSGRSIGFQTAGTEVS
ncbi:MAG TPA: hypothetical protein VNT51_12375, partial [Miltoncostaeaceae bacterium]|nr:hypothetical protein [Miltoncostaeaceae bacterium]